MSEKTIEHLKEKEKVLNQERLKSILLYDQNSGVFTWKATARKNRIGKTAGYKNPSGYNHITIKGKHYMSHRLAWLYIYGKWPNIIDHINGVKDDNRIENLRDVTTRVNGQNSKRHRNGKKVGTSFEKKSNRWRATFTEKDNKRFFIGMFDTEQEASDAYFDVINNPANRYKYRDKRFSKQRERDLVEAIDSLANKLGQDILSVEHETVWGDPNNVKITLELTEDLRKRLFKSLKNLVKLYGKKKE